MLFCQCILSQQLERKLGYSPWPNNQRMPHFCTCSVVRSPHILGVATHLPYLMKWKRCALANHPARLLQNLQVFPWVSEWQMKPGAGSAFCPLSLLGTLWGDSATPEEPHSAGGEPHRSCCMSQFRPSTTCKLLPVCQEGCEPGSQALAPSASTRCALLKSRGA